MAPVSHLSARTKEANTLSFWLRSVSGLSNSRIAPLLRTITRSALRMVCTRCWVGRRGWLARWAGHPRKPVLPQPGDSWHPCPLTPFIHVAPTDLRLTMRPRISSSFCSPFSFLSARMTVSPPHPVSAVLGTEPMASYLLGKQSPQHSVLSGVAVTQTLYSFLLCEALALPPPPGFKNYRLPRLSLSMGSSPVLPPPSSRGLGNVYLGIQRHRGLKQVKVPIS